MVDGRNGKDNVILVNEGERWAGKPSGSPLFTRGWLPGGAAAAKLLSRVREEMGMPLSLRGWTI